MILKKSWNALTRVLNDWKLKLMRSKEINMGGRMKALGVNVVGGKSADAGGKPMPKKNKVGKVMKEFASGKLKSSSGKKVTNPKQAKAIALSEAGMSKSKSRKKK